MGRNKRVHFFVISTPKDQLFCDTEQKGDKNIIKVRVLFIGELSSIDARYKEVFDRFNSKTFCPFFFRGCLLFRGSIVFS